MQYVRVPNWSTLVILRSMLHNICPIFTAVKIGHRWR